MQHTTRTNMPTTLHPPLEYVCFLSKATKETKGKAVPTYGILARVYNPDFDTCCTAMLIDGPLVVYGYTDVDKGLKRLNNKNDYCPLKKNTPREELARLLKARKNEKPSLPEVIIEMERLYDENQKALEVTDKRRRQHTKTDAGTKDASAGESVKSLEPQTGEGMG
jgi:hypothetical protein